VAGEEVENVFNAYLLGLILRRYTILRVNESFRTMQAVTLMCRLAEYNYAALRFYNLRSDGQAPLFINYSSGHMQP